MVEDKLYLNRGDFKFEDITSKAIHSGKEGWHTGVSMVDINADGYLDIYVCRGGDPKNYNDQTNLLYINNRDETFTEQASIYGLNDSLNSTQAAFFDYDRDGDLDAYVMNVPNELFNFTREEYLKLFQSKQNSSDHFFRNNKEKFEDVSLEMGINNHAFGLGLALGDIDNNGWTDIYVANDYEERDYLFMNMEGKFVEQLRNRTRHTSNFGMGVDIADFNNDGDADIMELDMAFPTHERSKRNMASMSTKKFWSMVKNGNHYQYMKNSLQINNGNGTFSDIAQLAGVAKTDWSWGALFADFDNDGQKDLIITNGQHRDLKDRDFQNKLKNKIQDEGQLSVDEIFEFAPKSQQSNFVFKNNGDLTFENTSKKWGFDQKINSNGIAYADLNNDGTIDVVVNNLDEKATIYKNTTVGHQNYISFSFKGHKKNTFAYGTKVKVYTKKGVQMQELHVTKGYISSVDPRLHFGLGELESILKAEIQWTDGQTTVLSHPEINKKHVVTYGKSNFQTVPKESLKQYFKDITTTIPIDYRHLENDFNDFDRELLLPHAFSHLGPCIVTADINSDGLDDVFIGGAKGQAGAVFVQNVDGEFLKMQENTFIKTQNSEDVTALFFDADGDGDQDLYIGSGGNDFHANAMELQDRLYLNDGLGNFTFAIDALPKMITSTGIVQAGDIDSDGDLDLFVGGRVEPGMYPTAPKSFLLLNNRGKFKDATSNYCPELSQIGMVTGAEFTDINGDAKNDLVLVGEWMGLTRFLNKGDSMELLPVEKQSEGLWFCLKMTDIDNDGDMDFIGGNIGKNSKFKASFKKPFNIYGRDFDGNGTFDIVLSAFQGETNYPVRGRECSSQQMPFIAEKYPTYKAFAQASSEELYGNELNKALHLTTRNLNSSIFINDGKGNFLMKSLPIEAQFSPLMDFAVLDINNDGNKDIIGVGNLFETEVETTRYDAGRGCVLLGNGSGGFTSLSPKQSGFFAWNNIRSIVPFTINGRKGFILGVNNSYPQVFLMK